MLKIDEDVDKLLREMTMCKNINKDDNKETDYCDVDHALSLQIVSSVTGCL